jgi:hypothetical protein
MIVASIINPVMMPMMMRFLVRSLEINRLQTGQLFAFHATFAPQQRQRKILGFITFVTSIHFLF